MEPFAGGAQFEEIGTLAHGVGGRGDGGGGMHGCRSQQAVHPLAVVHGVALHPLTPAVHRKGTLGPQYLLQSAHCDVHGGQNPDAGIGVAGGGCGGSGVGGGNGVGLNVQSGTGVGGPGCGGAGVHVGPGAFVTAVGAFVPGPCVSVGAFGARLGVPG
jgi:hypothetical protein